LRQLSRPKNIPPRTSAGTKSLKTFFHGHTYTANPLACRRGNREFEDIGKRKKRSTGYKPVITNSNYKMTNLKNFPGWGRYGKIGFDDREMRNRKRQEKPKRSYPASSKSPPKICRRLP